MASGNTLLTWTPLCNEAPASGPAMGDFRNGQPVLDFDASATETAIFSDVMPRHYAGGGITVSLHTMASTATSGNMIWETAFERCNTDADADSFATAVQSAATACNGTSGIVTVVAIAHTNGAQIDSIAVGERFRLRVQRIGGSGSDTMAGDAELAAVELRET